MPEWLNYAGCFGPGCGGCLTGVAGVFIGGVLGYLTGDALIGTFAQSATPFIQPLVEATPYVTAGLGATACGGLGARYGSGLVRTGIARARDFYTNR
jgi:hypothetical protein